MSANFVGFMVSFSLLLAFGDGTFNKVKLTGKYQVAHKEYHIKLNECAVSVFYPM
jgi:pimeloyl-ACP methyl ester carboxylesterase